MAYIKLSDLKGELDIDATGDNPLLQQAIKAAQDYIESQTNRVFEATTATRFYDSDARDADDSTLLHVDDDLLTVTTLANGATVYADLETATPVQVYSTTNDPPAPLVEGAVYFAILIASPVIQLATSPANALAGTAITLTDDGTGTQTIICHGTPIAATDFWLMPRNLGPPYHGIKLKSNEDVYWQWDPDDLVSVTGTWGYSTAVPYDIRRACTILAAFFYRQKDAQQFQTTAIVESGAIAIPQGIPATVDRILKRYRKYL
jgi:hypothetical protein